MACGSALRRRRGDSCGAGGARPAALGRSGAAARRCEALRAARGRVLHPSGATRARWSPWGGVGRGAAGVAGEGRRRVCERLHVARRALLQNAALLVLHSPHLRGVYDAFRAVGVARAARGGAGSEAGAPQAPGACEGFCGPEALGARAAAPGAVPRDTGGSQATKCARPPPCAAWGAESAARVRKRRRLPEGGGDCVAAHTTLSTSF